jgi:tripartite-type tricarboxylate transporter receptor subunit TctC
VVGSAPGGSNDTFARAIGKKLSEALGQPVVVDNKPAGGGVIANAYVAKAPPDGYNLVVLSSTFTTGAAIRNNLQYDAVKSFKPVAMLGKGPLLVTVPNESPYKTIGDLVAAAKANPGKLNYGTSGAGSINHFATELFADAAGIKLTHVPYKGMGPGHHRPAGRPDPVLVASAPSILGQVKGGRVRALAVTSANRSPVAPEPAFAGAVRLQGQRQRAVVGRAGAGGHAAAGGGPPQRRDQQDHPVGRDEGVLPQGRRRAASMKPAEFEAFIAAEIERWKQVAKAADIKPE